MGNCQPRNRCCCTNKSSTTPDKAAQQDTKDANSNTAIKVVALESITIQTANPPVEIPEVPPPVVASPAGNDAVTAPIVTSAAPHDPSVIVNADGPSKTDLPTALVTPTAKRKSALSPILNRTSAAAPFSFALPELADSPPVAAKPANPGHLRLTSHRDAGAASHNVAALLAPQSVPSIDSPTTSPLATAPNAASGLARPPSAQRAAGGTRPATAVKGTILIGTSSSHRPDYVGSMSSHAKGDWDDESDDENKPSKFDLQLLLTGREKPETTSTRTKRSGAFVPKHFQPWIGDENLGDVCDKLMCTNCDFEIICLEGRYWSKECEYLFFRKFMPDKSKLAKQTVVSQQYYAYCCQCCWRSVRGRESMASIVMDHKGNREPSSRRGDELARWRCAGHVNPHA